MQTVLTLIRRRVQRRLIWVYTVCQCPFYGTLGINGLNEGTLVRGRFDHYRLLTLSIRTNLNKQLRPRSDAAERGVWSESTLFATHPAI